MFAPRIACIDRLKISHALTRRTMRAQPVDHIVANVLKAKSDSILKFQVSYDPTYRIHDSSSHALTSAERIKSSA
ncbi:hypothetical protein Y032_0116g613 [Ancylostoma ceylanicum]|uniref:Uncharacterized protein n=1 Tax=Ancylostoma ceylanicum TaxID=53326 RepID=A0A016TCK9_9BILA|nr:hypothetical protein Y032_0116g613 [Ancylostoma ceylanicum]